MDRAGVAIVAHNGLLYAVAVYARFAKVLTQEQVEDAIAAMLRARGIPVAQNRQDARWRCAGRGILSVDPASALVFQSPDLSSLAATFDQTLSQTHFARAAVGSCPAKDAAKGATQYRVAVLFYSSVIGVY
jgi:hypothetical protein